MAYQMFGFGVCEVNEATYKALSIRDIDIVCIHV